MGAPPSYNSTMSPIEPVFNPVPDPLFRTSEPDPSPYRPSQAFPPTHPAQGRESLRHPPPPRPPKPVINSPKPRPKQDTYARELLAEASKQNTKIIAMEKFTATKVGHGYHAIDSEKSSPPKPSQVPASSAPVTSPPTIAPPVQTKPQKPQLPPHYYEEDAEKEGCCRKCVRHRIRHKCSVALVLSIFLFVLSLLGTGYQLSITSLTCLGSSIYVILKKTCWLKYDLSTSGSEDCVDYETMPFPYPWYMVIGATCASGLTAIVLLFITIFSCWKKCFRAFGCLLALVAWCWCMRCCSLLWLLSCVSVVEREIPYW